MKLFKVLLPAFILSHAFIMIYGQTAGANGSWDLKKLNTAVNESYMKAAEKDMILEINKLRSDPGKYAVYIKPYLVKAKYKLQKYGKGDKNYSLTTNYTIIDGKQSIKTDTNWHYSNEEELKAVESLVRELGSLKPMSVLKPSKAIYLAAKSHALDQVPTGTIDHRGTDGSWPWDRIKKAAPDMEEGGENIACGEDSARSIVIQLLIDSGIPGYGHRKTLLNPQWTHCGCYCAGILREDFNCNYWIQNFGKKKQ